MKVWNYLWLIALICMVGFGSILACGDDDDDDDDNENPSVDDDDDVDDDEDSDDDEDNDDDADDDDDDDLSAGLAACVQMLMACWDFPEATATETCNEYYDLAEECGVTDAVAEFVDCVGSDCSAWDACVVAWEDAINC